MERVMLAGPAPQLSRARRFVMKLAPRDFVFRSREFEQMEIEYFVKSRKLAGSVR